MAGFRESLGRKTPGIARFAGVFYRAFHALRYYTPQLGRIARWSLQSREFGNFTYALSDVSYQYLAHTLSVITGETVSRMLGYMNELGNDIELREFVIASVRQSPHRYESDDTCEFGRRVGWYAMARAAKPRVVVETGVDKGLGSVVLCAALRRNAAEGAPGQYFGTDINPNAGWLLRAPYDSVGRILYGDSIETLRRFDREIDLFVNDSDHSPEYEFREYLEVDRKLSAGAVVLGDNAHVSDSLARFSLQAGRRFVYFRETPKDHWYPGAGIGFSFPPVRTNV